MYHSFLIYHWLLRLRLLKILSPLPEIYPLKDWFNYKSMPFTKYVYTVSIATLALQQGDAASSRQTIAFYTYDHMQSLGFTS